MSLLIILLLRAAPVFSFQVNRTCMPPAGVLVINELLPDPSPAIGLPDAEFIELLNTGSQAVDLAGLQLSDGGKPAVFPPGVFLEPGALLIITRPQDTTLFKPYGQVLGLTGFPTLNNGGDRIELRTVDGALLDAVTYTLESYGQSDKSAGGWSLERYRTDIPGDCFENWSASLAPAGGTPGDKNALSEEDLPTSPPQLLQVLPLSEFEVEVRFDIPPSSPSNLVELFHIPDGPEIEALLPTSLPTSLILLLNTALQSRRVYTLQIAPGLASCTEGRNPRAQEALFALPEPPEAGDLRINELLFYPRSGSADFVELFNASNKTVQLAGLELINLQKTSGKTKARLTNNHLLFPGQWVALTTDTADIRMHYPGTPSSALLYTDLPGFDTEEGNVTLLFGSDTLDHFNYREEMHHPLLSDRRGVSLERLSTQLSTNDPSNWASAAQAEGFATPGRPNSQQLALASEDEMVIFEPPFSAFSPNGDGYRDELLLPYQLDGQGFSLKAMIFDTNGRPVFQLANNELLGVRGLLRWNGSGNKGNPAPAGWYIFQAELYHPQKGRQRQKESVILIR